MCWKACGHGFRARGPAPAPGMTSFLDFLTPTKAGTRGFREVPRTPLSAGVTGLHDVGPAHMPIYATTCWVDAQPSRKPSRPPKKLPNSQRILRLVTSDKWGTCSMFRPCLIHPVTPLLSLLAPLFRPIRSPVRGLRTPRPSGGNPLTFLVFCSDCARHAEPQKSFAPVIRAKTGERRAAAGRGDRDQARFLPQKIVMSRLSLPARSLRGRPASLRTFADGAGGLLRKRLI
jgi:hypothetical protein